MAKEKKKIIFFPKNFLVMFFLLTGIFVVASFFFARKMAFFNWFTPSFFQKTSNFQALQYQEMAVNDLARRFNIPKKEIAIVSLEEKNWRDTSLGCPKKGKVYAQMIVPGFLLTLSFKGKKYEYHGGLNQVVFCFFD